jgi:hypothetical protein
MNAKSTGYISADKIAQITWLSLARDFDLESQYASACAALHRGDIVTFRSATSKEVGIVDPIYFKKRYQLDSLLKKYRFDADVYSDEDLRDLTFSKFMKGQERLAKQQHAPTPCWVQAVTGRARFHARRILGDFTMDDIYKEARFGKKASIGCPLSKAYIDLKLTSDGAFTGSSQGHTWFKGYLETDALLSRIISAQPVYAESLELQQVPKTWKIHRLITPLPLVDLFYTFGVGGLVEERLAQEGLDISKLPSKHQWYVSQNSTASYSDIRGGYLATGDLSDASNSLVSWLLNRVLPRKWYRAIQQAFFRQVTFDGRRFEVCSVLPMGNGCTFPVETLVFYCLLLAIRDLTGVKGTISVFGDDLIYPRSMHQHVVRVYESLGLVFNLDKTYVSFPFRESCGEDFYRGIPVRPAQLKTADSIKNALTSISYIYKVLNTLLRRWQLKDIPYTVDRLLELVNLLGYPVFRVPPSFPDQSGLKVFSPVAFVTHHSYEPINVRFAHGSRWFEFSYLKLFYKARAVIAQEPYYWLSLSQRDDTLPNHWAEEVYPWHEPTKEWCYQLTEAPRQVFTWRKIKPRKIRLSNGKTVMKRANSKPYVASRVLRKIGVAMYQVPEAPDFAGVSDWLVGRPAQTERVFT